MNQTFTKFKKIIFFLSLLSYGLTFAQDDAQNVTINFTSITDNAISTTAINNNKDIALSLNFTVPVTNYNIIAKLSNDSAVVMNKVDTSNGNNLNYLIKRTDFNKTGITDISFTITDITDNRKTITYKVTLNAASLAKGNILDDAIALQNAGTNEQLIIDIISYYAGKPLTKTTLQTAIDNNPYLQNVMSTTKAVAANQLLDVRTFNTGLTGAPAVTDGASTVMQAGSVGGIEVTKYANAMAEIMIDHAKEELTIAFFNRFQNFIKEHEEFRVLFPKTSDKIENLLTYKYPEMIKALRVAFLDDVRKIAYTIDDVFALPKYEQLTAQYPQITIAIKSMRLVHQLETGGLNAAGVLSAMANFKEWNMAGNSNNFKNVGNALKAANAINQSISYVDKNGKTEWHETDKIAKLIKDDKLFIFYMGLLYEKEFNATTKISFIDRTNTAITFTTILQNKANNLFFFQNKLQEFMDLTTIVKKTQAEVIQKQGKLTNQDRFTYISNSIDVLEYAMSLYNYFDPTIEVSEEYVAILRLSNDIYKNVYEEHYNAAISNALDLFVKLSNLKIAKVSFSQSEITAIEGKINGTLAVRKRLTKVAGKLKGDTSKLKLEDIQDLETNVPDVKLKQLIESLKGSSLANFVEKAKPFALFMANIVEAKDEKDVKAALDAAILPVGSSSIKKNSDFNFNIQSYLGARLSFTDSKTAVQNTWNDRFALSAPIGLSISYGLDNNYGAISLFVPILDLGAIVDYKLKYKNEGTPNEEVESKDYTVKLGQIFSPGAYLVYGFGANIPISFGIGGQYGPGLSKIKEDNATDIGNPYWKWNAFLSVDIPLFNLANKAKVK